jgi:hypothetical protein
MLRYILSAFLLLTSCLAQDASLTGRKEIALSPEVLAKYVGTYELAPKFNIMIALDGGQLMAQASGQGKLPLYASSETQFFYKVVDAQIDFNKDAAGKVVSLTLHQNNNDIKGLRISDKVAERKEISVSPEILAKYVGVYELQPGADVTITLEGGQLFGQITGQQKFPLFAESETVFFLKVADAQNEFIKDDKGAVTHLIIRQGPNEVKAPRK